MTIPIQPTRPGGGGYPPITPGIAISLEQWQEYLELKRKAEEYDLRTNQPDCVKPDLEEWETKMKRFLKKLTI